MIARRPLRGVLEDAGMPVEPGAAAADPVRSALARLAGEDLPWYLRVLAGGAAWVAALFLIGVLIGLVTAITGGAADVAAVLLGVVLIPTGVWLGRGRGGDFRRQTALVSVMAGQMCIIGGVGGQTSSLVPAAVATLLTSACLIGLFDDAAYRVVATLAVVAAAVAIAIDMRLPGALGLATGVTGLLPVILWRASPELAPRHRLLDPVAWGSVVSCVALLSLQAGTESVLGVPGETSGLGRVMTFAPWALTLTFTGALGWLTLRIARDHTSSIASPTVLVGLAVVLTVGLLTSGLPAVSAALLFTVLGFDRRRSGLVGLAAACLVGALGLYYYSLALTLFHKSLLLMGSGAACLGAAAYFRQQAREASA